MFDSIQNRTKKPIGSSPSQVTAADTHTHQLSYTNTPTLTASLSISHQHTHTLMASPSLTPSLSHQHTHTPHHSFTLHLTSTHMPISFTSSHTDAHTPSPFLSLSATHTPNPPPSPISHPFVVFLTITLLSSSLQLVCHGSSHRAISLASNSSHSCQHLLWFVATLLVSATRHGYGTSRVL